MTLHYERLLSAPVETMTPLIAFLGIANATEILPAVAEDIPSQLRTGNSDKWRPQLPIDQQRLFESIAGDQLSAAGSRSTGRACACA